MKNKEKAHLGDEIVNIFYRDVELKEENLETKEEEDEVAF